MPNNWYDYLSKSRIPLTQQEAIIGPVVKSRWSKLKDAFSDQWDTASQFPPIRAVSRLGELTDEGLRGRLRNQEDIDQLNEKLGSNLTVDDAKIGVMIDKPGKGKGFAKAVKSAKKTARRNARRAVGSKPKVESLPPSRQLTSGTRFTGDELGNITDRTSTPITYGPTTPYTKRNPYLGDIENFIQGINKEGRVPDTHSNPLTQPSPNSESTKFFRSNRAAVRGQGKAGQSIDNKLTAAETTGEVIAGSWLNRFNKTVKGIKPDTFSKEIVPYLNDSTKVIPETHKYTGVIDKLRGLDNEIASAGERAKLGFIDAEGNKTLFQRRENGYWPRYYDKSVWEDSDSMVQALVKKHGLTEKEAKAAINRASESGGRIYTTAQDRAASLGKQRADKIESFQHARELDLDNYRTDPDAYRLHIMSMGKQLGREKYLGAGDIVSGKLVGDIKELPKATSKSTTDILKRVIGREGTAAPSEGARRAGNALSSLGTTSFLSNFMINNPVQLAATISRASPKASLKMLGNVVRKGARKEAGELSGATIPVHGESVTDSSLPGFLGRYLGIEQNESGVRQLASMAGTDTANDYFKAVKKNPNKKRILDELEKLTLTPKEELLTQDSLTPFQQRVAGNRMSAMTQGLNRPMAKPYNWTGGTGEPYKKAALMFKNFAFMQPDIMMESIKANPVKGTLGGLAGYSTLGSGAGVVKDAISAAYKSKLNASDLAKNYEEARDRRGNYLPKPLPNWSKKGIDALLQGYAFGLPADAASAIASGNKLKMWEMLNPLFSRGVNIAAGGIKAAKGGESDDLKRELIKSVPLPLSSNALANALYPYKKSSGGRTGRTGRTSSRK